MKTYEIELTTTSIKRNEAAKHTYSTRLTLENSAKIGDMLSFFADTKKLYHKAMQASRREEYVELTICCGTYTRDNNGTLESIDFDCWTHKGYNEDPDGIYLAADTRYTPAEHDLYLSANVLQDLSNI